MNSRLLISFSATAAVLLAPVLSRALQPIKEDWESSANPLPTNFRTGTEIWQFSRGEGRGEGKIEVVEGKGRNGGKALSLALDGERGMATYAAVTIPLTETQDFRFSIRRDGNDPVEVGLFVRKDRRKLLRVAIKGSEITLGVEEGGRRRAMLRGMPDAEGWLDIGLRIDRKAKTATLRVNEEEKSVEISEWEEGGYKFQFGLNFDKGNSRQPVLIDDVSWLGESR